MRASRGKVAAKFIATCCERVHCALVRFGVSSIRRFGLKKELPRARLPEWAETLPSLAMGWKRSRIQQPSTWVCIFLPVRVIQG